MKNSHNVILSLDEELDISREEYRLGITISAIRKIVLIICYALRVGGDA